MLLVIMRTPLCLEMGRSPWFAKFQSDWTLIEKHSFLFRYTTPKGLTVIQWIVDLGDRMKQLQNIAKITNANGAKELKSLKVWLGGLFIPEAYVTATRQFVAQANQWSLEELYLKVTIADNTNPNLKVDDCSFVINGKRKIGR